METVCFWLPLLQMGLKSQKNKNSLLIDSFAGFHQRRSSGFKGTSKADSDLEPRETSHIPSQQGVSGADGAAHSRLLFFSFSSGYNME